MAKSWTDPMQLVKTAILSLFIAGILSVVLSSVFIAIDGLMAGIMAIIVAFILVYLAKKTKLDKMVFAEWIILLLLMAGLGSLIGSFIPQITDWMLSVNDFTLTGLGFSLMYIFIADLIIEKLT